MASSKAYLDFILDQLSGLDEISCRAMMGEYILYYRGKIIGGIYDDRFLQCYWIVSMKGDHNAKKKESNS